MRLRRTFHRVGFLACFIALHHGKMAAGRNAVRYDRSRSRRFRFGKIKGETMRSSYDAVVIGSGFGGAVAGCRLAQARLNVAILERGRRYRARRVPARLGRPQQRLALAAIGQGLFDVRPFGEMTIVQGAGWGGGSLIYANVHLRPPADLFQRGWPAGYSRAALDPYYDLVAYMLDIAPITASSHLGVPPKAAWMKQVAGQAGARGSVLLPEPRRRFFRARRDASQQVRRRAERMHLLRRVRHRLQRAGQEHARFQLPRACRAARRRRRTAQRGRSDRARRRRL